VYEDYRWNSLQRGSVLMFSDHGNALLSRFPIIGFTNHDVSQPGDESRGLLHCVLLPDGGSQLLHGVCVHLIARVASSSPADRLLALLARQVPPNAPLIVAGDFNDGAVPWRCAAADWSKVSRSAWRELRAVFRPAGRAARWTASM
jgi:endonuclease/exonuclease/phosphatase family metal-dependent hydrolase